MPIVVCGHSLGAAEAIIVGMYLTKAGYKVDTIVASGPPKVTDAEGWETFKDLPVLRITAAFDPMPFLPPAKLYAKSPFEQGGPLLMLLDGPYFTVAPSAYYDAMNPAFQDVTKASDHFDVLDHRVWTYRDRVVEKRGEIHFVPFAEWKSFAKPRR
jgi:pimeloyl-ACP methyl ester carboxylesterase